MRVRVRVRVRLRVRVRARARARVRVRVRSISPYSSPYLPAHLEALREWDRLLRYVRVPVVSSR